MTDRRSTLTRPTMIGFVLITVLTLLPTVTQAQRISEFYIGAAYIGGGETGLSGAPVKLEFEDDWGLTLGGGHHINNQLFLNGELLYAKSTFTGTSEEDDSVLRQSMRQWGITAGFEYNLLESPVTPYITAGLGFTYLETDDPHSDPEFICRPDFYWGWWCDWVYPVYSDWFFTYYAGVGIRYDINYTSVLRLAYKSNWINVSNVTSTPRQDMISLTWGGKF